MEQFVDMLHKLWIGSHFLCLVSFLLCFQWPNFYTYCATCSVAAPALAIFRQISNTLQIVEPSNSPKTPLSDLLDSENFVLLSSAFLHLVTPASPLKLFPSAVYSSLHLSWYILHDAVPLSPLRLSSLALLRSTENVLLAMATVADFLIFFCHVKDWLRGKTSSIAVASFGWTFLKQLGERPEAGALMHHSVDILVAVYPSCFLISVQRSIYKLVPLRRQPGPNTTKGGGTTEYRDGRDPLQDKENVITTQDKKDVSDRNLHIGEPNKSVLQAQGKKNRCVESQQSDQILAESRKNSSDTEISSKTLGAPIAPEIEEKDKNGEGLRQRLCELPKKSASKKNYSSTKSMEAMPHHRIQVRVNNHKVEQKPKLQVTNNNLVKKRVERYLMQVDNDGINGVFAGKRMTDSVNDVFSRQVNIPRRYREKIAPEESIKESYSELRDPGLEEEFLSWAKPSRKNTNSARRLIDNTRM
ncbi:putative nucleoporin [Clavispora lusitaniae]|uniref:Nucleoporin n=1 Tax=Clavispora lusitaniae TaxID=36911 RepID=A0ACD0WIF6_CLALS|nr:putative nucleoporin [Clavispora lusitaniae]QFZ32684.1 putative nucleoporin [Clavispora lusitaniae]QFZ38353.1 putative nucleoporin [Clavispora lusitaniae]QFZ44036.1 putative nucleoporin [Clavispora lusitaniae]QFZ49713.1 putative nucleoporin [Clavispora lusitaniae]